MSKLAGLIFFLAVYLHPVSSYALNWKALHEKADAVSLGAALEAVSKPKASGEDFYVLGLVYLNLHKDQEAKGAFQESVRADPQLFAAEWGMAEVKRRQHKLQESQKALEEMIKAHPQFWPAHISLAYIKYTRMDFAQAVKLAQRIESQGRNNVDLSNYVRSILIVAGAKGMIAHYGGPLSKLFNGTAVFPNLKKAKRLKPDDPGVLFGLGSFYLLAPTFAGGDRSQARTYLERAIKLDPGFTDAYVRLAQLCKIEGDREKYSFYLDKALQLDPLNELALDIKEGKCKFICLQEK